MTSSQTYRVGDAEVVRVVDCTIDAFLPGQLLPDWRESDVPLRQRMPEAMAPDGQHVMLSIHSWVVRRDGKVIIVDTGVGNAKPRPFARYFDGLKTAYLDRLRDVGVAPEQVDYVLHTHLHVDHVGWNTVLQGDRWVPTFPNARHVFSAKEYAWFTDPANLSERNRTSFQVQTDSVTPIVEAGMADMITVTGAEIIPGFSFHPTPGHSADHASIVLESAGVRAIFAGDIVHHPIQIAEPHLLSIFDPDRERALVSRRWALDFAADQGALMFSSHFSATSAGYVSRDGESYNWHFA